MNGSLERFLNSSRSLRQGDLLSPFLFVIVMDARSRMLGATVSGVLLSGFTVRGPQDGFSIVSNFCS